MSDLCQYKNTFGEVGTGIHSYRIFNIAYMDVIITIICSLTIAWIFKWNYIYTTICIFILGIWMHHIFCVRTTVDKLLFSDAL